MVPLKLWLLVFGVALDFLTEATGKESEDPLAAAFQTLRGEEKTEFLTYFLAVGLRDWAMSQPRSPKFYTLTRPDALTKSLNISKENIEKFESMNIPKDSRRKLLEWTRKEFNLSTRNLVELVKSRQCFRSICWPDIGDLCCPW